MTVVLFNSYFSCVWKLLLNTSACGFPPHSKKELWGVCWSINHCWVFLVCNHSTIINCVIWYSLRPLLNSQSPKYLSFISVLVWCNSFFSVYKYFSIVKITGLGSIRSQWTRHFPLRPPNKKPSLGLCIFLNQFLGFQRGFLVNFPSFFPLSFKASSFTRIVGIVLISEEKGYWLRQLGWRRKYSTLRHKPSPLPHGKLLSCVNAIIHIKRISQSSAFI